MALGYDTANQPTSMSVSGTSATYIYDGNLKRIKTVENGVTTYSIYSKVTGNILHTYKPASNEGVLYLSGGGITVRANTHNGGYVVTYPMLRARRLWEQMAPRPAYSGGSFTRHSVRRRSTDR